MSASLPRGEQEFFDQQDIIMKAIVANMVLWGLDQARVHDVLQVGQAKYVQARNACQNPKTTTPEMIDHRNKMMEEYREELSLDVGALKMNPRVSEEWLNMMNIAHGKGGGKPTDPPKEEPLVGANTSVSTEVELQFRNIKTGKMGKPRGASGVRFRVGVAGGRPDDPVLLKYHIDTVPINPQGLPFQDFVSNSKYLLKFLKEHAGLLVYVSACYVNAVGKEGTWSDVVRFVIP
jgi:hypothetical protein